LCPYVSKRIRTGNVARLVTQRPRRGHTECIVLVVRRPVKGALLCPYVSKRIRTDNVARLVTQRPRGGHIEATQRPYRGHAEGT
jgi:hypothetical protein